MLRLLGTEQIRLTPREVARFTQITGFVPENIRSMRELDAYVESCKAHFAGADLDARFLRWLIDRERNTLLAA